MALAAKGIGSPHELQLKTGFAHSNFKALFFRNQHRSLRNCAAIAAALQVAPLEIVDILRISGRDSRSYALRKLMQLRDCHSFNELERRAVTGKGAVHSLLNLEWQESPINMYERFANASGMPLDKVLEVCLKS